jgi:hypothetical protein
LTATRGEESIEVWQATSRQLAAVPRVRGPSFEGEQLWTSHKTVLCYQNDLTAALVALQSPDPPCPAARHDITAVATLQVRVEITLHFATNRIEGRALFRESEEILDTEYNAKSRRRPHHHQPHYITIALRSLLHFLSLCYRRFRKGHEKQPHSARNTTLRGTTTTTIPTLQL